MKNHHDMSVARRVSLWLSREPLHGEALDDYVSVQKQFASDFGFEIDPPAGPETTSPEWTVPAPLRPVADLLREFSFEHAWRGAAVALAAAQGWHDARLAIVFHSFEYDRTLIRDQSTFTFIGTVDFVETKADELERQIRASPDDDSLYAVYGDWLEGQGDPRGRLIATQLARAAAPEDHEEADTALAETEAALIEELGDPVVDVEPPPRFEWHAGFWRALYLGGFGWSAKPPTSEHVTALLAAPSAKFLRGLSIDGRPTTLLPITTAAATLERLDVSARSDKLTDDWLMPLGLCTRLRSLKLFSCEQVTSKGLESLRPLKALESIDLRNHPLDDGGAAVLGTLPKLCDVFFNRTTPRFTWQGMKHFAALPLTSLALGHDGLDDSHVAELAGHQTLANFELRNSRLSGMSYEALGTLSLRRLVLGRARCDDLRGLVGLAPTLRSLWIGHGKDVDRRACESIGRLTRLACLDLSSTGISGASLHDLAPLRDLEQLDLGFLDLTDQDVDALLGFSKLRTLSLAYSRQITDAAVERIVAAFPSLESLDLSATSITPRGIEMLDSLPKLTSLGLNDARGELRDAAQARDRWYVATRDLLEMWDSLDDYPA